MKSIKLRVDQETREALLSLEGVLIRRKMRVSRAALVRLLIRHYAAAAARAERDGVGIFGF